MSKTNNELYKDKRFGDLKIGDIFYVWGDVHINYDYPMWCECKKDSTYSGVEITGGSLGVGFVMASNDIIHVLRENENELDM